MLPQVNTLYVPPVIGVRQLAYLVAGFWIHWSPSGSWLHQLPGAQEMHTYKRVSLVARLTCSQPRDILVSLVTCLDFVVPPVAKSQIFWSLQYLAQTHGCSNTWLPSFLHYLPASPAWCLPAITCCHMYPGNMQWALASSLAGTSGTWAL